MQQAFRSLIPRCTSGNLHWLCSTAQICNDRDRFGPTSDCSRPSHLELPPRSATQAQRCTPYHPDHDASCTYIWCRYRPFSILTRWPDTQDVVSVYRLIVMRNKTPSLESLGPHSLNTTTSKALFYIFHVSPELLATLSLFLVNARDVFSTGMFGDYRHRDPKPKAADGGK